MTYILPIRTRTPVDDELIRYVHSIAAMCEVVVVDGSPPAVFESFAARCAPGIRHIPVARDFERLLNGKVAGVLTALRVASHEHIVIADDDVRYDAAGLAMIGQALDHADVVRPQNYFDPLPWHACVDTARSLVNRVTGGDWPGTLAVRGSTLRRTEGYGGDVMFENLELIRTVTAIGGREAVRRDLYVRRLPPSTRQFFSQRVRHAYDEFARPWRLVTWLAVLPLLLLASKRSGRTAAAWLALSIVPAEMGRRIDGGARVFPLVTSLVTPVWICERALSIWCAVVSRIVFGGIRYRGRIIKVAASSAAELRRRHAVCQRPRR